MANDYDPNSWANGEQLNVGQQIALNDTTQNKDYWDDQQRRSLYGWHGSQNGEVNDLARLHGLAQDWGSRNAPVIDYRQADADAANAGESRLGQSDTLDMLRHAAVGDVPSVAQQQLGAGLDASLKGQAALANSARGGAQHFAAAQHQAAVTGADLAAQTNQQQGILRAKEMADARNALFAAQSQRRAQDLMARGMSAAQAQAQAQLELQQHGLNQSGALGYEGLGVDVGKAALQGREAYQGNDTDLWSTQSNLDAGSQARADSNIKTVIGAGTGALGAGLAAYGNSGGGKGDTSDANLKQNIQPVGFLTSGAATKQNIQPIGTGAPTGNTMFAPPQVSQTDPGGDAYRESLAQGASRYAPGSANAGPGYMPSMYGANGKPAAPADDPSQVWSKNYGLNPALIGHTGTAGFNPAQPPPASPGAQVFGTSQFAPPSPSPVSYMPPQVPAYAPRPPDGSTLFSDERAKKDAHLAGVADGMQRALSAQMSSPVAVRQALETSQLSQPQREGFGDWLARSGVRDLDHPDSHYDYRGAYASGQKAGPDAHWVDTYKQHGHPTFSEESKYSKGPGDGGTWDGDRFVPPAPTSQMLDHLHPYAYTYKPESGEDPSKQRFGVMAQDLERSPMGKSVVVDTPQGKKVDVPQATGVQFAALADIHNRLRRGGL